jgi:hypothetical protein
VTFDPNYRCPVGNQYCETNIRCARCGEHRCTNHASFWRREVIRGKDIRGVQTIEYVMRAYCPHCYWESLV